MLREICFVLLCANVIQTLTSGNVLAQSAPSVGTSSSKQYFQWDSSNGSPPLSPDPYCGDTRENQDERAQSFSVQRDLGQGVNVSVGMSRSGSQYILVTLLFRFRDGKLNVSPENIELYVQGMGANNMPRKIVRDAYLPKNTKCQQLGEWVQLQYVIESNNVSTAELRFPAGTAVKDNALNIQPFGFRRIRE